MIVLGLVIAAAVWWAALRRVRPQGGRLAPIERAIDRGDWAHAGELAEAELARGASHLPGAASYLHYAAGRAALLGRDLDAAVEHLDQALFGVVTGDGSSEGERLVEYLPGFDADCRFFLGLALLQRGDLPKAEIVLDGVRRDPDYNGDRWSIVRHLAVIARARGRLADARLMLDDALSAAVDADDHGAAADTLRGIGQVDEQQGDLTTAAARYLRSIEESRRARESRGGRADVAAMADEAITRLLLARTLALAGATEEAGRRLEEARAMAPRDFVDMAAHVAFFASGVARCSGRPEEAARLAVEARAGYADLQMHLMAEYAGRERGRALAQLGATDDARDVLTEVVEGFGRCGADLEAEITRAELAELER